MFIEKVIADILKQWKAVQDKQRRQFRSIWKDDGYVFTGEFGGHLFPDTPNGWLDDFADKYGFPHIHPHMFRHTHASILIACGEDIATVSQRLGHTSINTTTKIYLHSFSENDRSASLLFTKAVMPDEINIKEYFRQ